MSQFTAFCASAEKAKRLEQVSMIMAVNAAQAEPKHIKETIEKLMKG